MTYSEERAPRTSARDKPRIRRPRDNDHGQHGVAQLRAERGGDGHSQDDAREGEHDVGDTHDDRVDGAREEPRYGPQGRADHHGHCTSNAASGNERRAP